MAAHILYIHQCFGALAGAEASAVRMENPPRSRRLACCHGLAANIMKKQVSVLQLKFGVYIHELDRPWTETPFMFQGFVLSNDKQLETLKKHCKKVTIDTEKGFDVSAAPFSTAGPMRKDSTSTEKSALASGG